jgi:hypothetical protein
MRFQMAFASYPDDNLPTPEGTFPSVTNVVGWEKQKMFAEWREKNKKESQRVCDRGTLLHSKIESYLLNEDVQLNDEDNLFTLFSFT